MNLSKIKRLFLKTYSEWQNDRAPQLGAALAYYSVFSLAPLLIITIAIVSRIFGEEAAKGEVVKELSKYTGFEVAKSVQNLINNTYEPSSSIALTVFGVITLLYAASAIFTQLKTSLNQIWEAPKNTSENFGTSVISWLEEKVFGVAMVFLCGIVIILSLMLSLLFNQANTYVDRLFKNNGLYLQLANLFNILGTFILLAVFFALIFKIFIHKKLSWQVVFIGGSFTSLLFLIGKTVLSMYLSYASARSTYSAAGAVLLLLLWIYYSAQIFYFGAEFTKVLDSQNSKPLLDDILIRNKSRISILKKGLVVLGITGIVSFLSGVLSTVFLKSLKKRK